MTVTAENDAPVVTSLATASFVENDTGIAYQAAGFDPEGTTLTWSLGGADAALFSIDGTGAVRFVATPNFEAPTDVGGNDIYDITVTASDGTLSSTARAVAITVSDVIEAVTLIGGSGADSLTGAAGNDTLVGGEGNARLDGGLGADSLAGGVGDDTYVVDNAGDVVVELAGEGYDRVIASINWTLGAELERPSLTGTANLNGNGNALANRIDGNTGANILDAGDGNDSLYGVGGNDTLIGGAGADFLDGGAGADRLEGELGVDRFYFRSVGEANGDVIADFSVIQGDRIDLRAIDTNGALAGDQGFAWIGGAAFGSVAGQLRFAGGMLEGDVNGDATADFQIALSGVALLTPANIWLRECPTWRGGIAACLAAPTPPPPLP